MTTDEKDAEFRFWYGQGPGDRAISRMVYGADTRKTAVNRWRERNGLPVQRRGPSWTLALHLHGHAGFWRRAVSTPEKPAKRTPHRYAFDYSALGVY